MKKLSIYLLTIFSALFLFSCEEDLIVYEGEDFIYFKSASADIGEASGEAVEIVIERTNADAAINVSLSVQSYYADDPDTEAAGTYNLSASSVSMAAGEYAATLTLTPIDNISADGAKVVVLEIASVNTDINIGYPGESNSNAVTQITINDDDCPVNSEAFVGIFDVSEVFIAGTNEGLSLAAAFGEVYLLEIAQDPADPSGTKFIINNVEGANQFFEPNTRVNLNTCGKTITLPGGSPNIALFADMTVESTSYNDNSGQMVFTGTLGNFGAYEIVLQQQ